MSYSAFDFGNTSNKKDSKKSGDWGTSLLLGQEYERNTRLEEKLETKDNLLQ